MARIAMRVSDERKRQYEQAAEERDDVTSVSDLLRTAVAHELSDRYGVLPRDGGGGGSGVSGEQFDRLSEDMDSIRNRMEALEGTVHDATEALHTSQTAQADGLAADVFDALPRSEERAVGTEGVASQVRSEVPERVARSQTPESVTGDKNEYDTTETELSDELKVSTQQIRVALEGLEDSTGVVNKKAHPESGWDDPQWWRSQ